MNYLKVFVVWMLLTFVYSVTHAAEWDTVDKTLGITAATATIIDWAQTREIAKQPTRFYEKGNPFLGEHPSIKQVNACFAGSLIGGYFLADILPPNWRKGFLSGATILEIGVIGQNKRLGINVKL